MTVTLYIEDTEIKLLTVSGRRVEKWGSLILEQGMVADGVIQDADQVAAKIRKLAQAQKTGGSVIVGLSGLNSIFRIITLPVLPKSLLDEAIVNEAARVIPVPLEQVYLAHQQIANEGGEVRYFLVAYPKSATDALIRTVNLAGLRIRSIDIAPLALARCVDAPQSIVVNNWLSSVDIAVVVSRVPEVVRSFNLAIESSSAEDRLQNIAEEISRTVTFYNTSHPEAPIAEGTPVLVSGELARDESHWPLLSADGKHPVKMLGTCFNTPESFETYHFMVNLGLATRDSGANTEFGSVISINALPQIYLPKKFNWANVILPIPAIVMIAGLYYGWTYIQNMKTTDDAIAAQAQSVQSQIIKQQSTLSAIKAQVAAVPSPTPIQNTTASLTSMLIDWNTQRVVSVESVKDAVFWATYEQMFDSSGNSTLQTITFSGNTLTITGTAVSEQIVFKYAADLRDADVLNRNSFSAVVVTDITEVPPLAPATVPTYNFTLTLVH